MESLLSNIQTRLDKAQYLSITGYWNVASSVPPILDVLQKHGLHTGERVQPNALAVYITPIKEGGNRDGLFNDLLAAIQNELVLEREEGLLVSFQANLWRAKVRYPAGVGPIEMLEQSIFLDKLRENIGDGAYQLSVLNMGGEAHYEAEKLFRENYPESHMEWINELGILLEVSEETQKCLVEEKLRQTFQPQTSQSIRVRV